MIGLPATSTKAAKIADVTAKINAVQGITCSFQQHRREIVKASTDIKREIQRSGLDLIDAVHGRQTQLLRQVDVLHGQQLYLLQTQIAQLHRTLGSLRSSLHSLEQCGSDREAAKVHVENVEGCEQLRLPPKLQHMLDPSRIIADISTFGSVGMDGIPTLLESNDPTAFPAKLEEYMDANQDHHVMYKPLPKGGKRLTFPPLDGETDQWLMPSKTEKKRICSGVPQVGQWLQQLEPCPEPSLEECCWNEFELIDSPQDNTSDDSDSVEIIPSTPVEPVLESKKIEWPMLASTDISPWLQSQHHSYTESLAPKPRFTPILTRSDTWLTISCPVTPARNTVIDFPCLQRKMSDWLPHSTKPKPISCHTYHGHFPPVGLNQVCGWVQKVD